MATFADTGSTTGSGQARGQRTRYYSNFSSDRTRRSTAGNNRIYSGRPSRGGARGVGHLDWFDFVATIGAMRADLEKLPPHEVRALGALVRDEVKRQGRPYRIRGRNGDKIRLSAKMTQNRVVLRDKATGKILLTKGGRRQLGRTSQASVSVVGDPKGFWGIVEHGSGRHLITPSRKRGGRYTSRGAFSAFLSSAGLRMVDGVAENYGGFKDFVPGGAALKLDPANKPGFAAWVDHPGHGSLGRPWRRAMVNSRRIVRDYHNRYTTQVLVDAWARGTK